MDSYEVIREALHKAGAKKVAADLNLSLSSVYKWGEPQVEDTGSGASNPLDRVNGLYQSTQDPRLIQWLCARADGFFVKNPKSEWPHPYLAIPATHKIVQEFADLLSVVASATGDNHITRQEAKAIRSRWEELKSATEGFVRGAEDGNFRNSDTKSPAPSPSAGP